MRTMLRIGSGRQAGSRADEGQVLVEYSLILLLIVLVCIVVLSNVGGIASQLLDAVVGGF